MHHYLKKFFTLPPHVTVKKAAGKAAKAIQNSVDRKRDIKISTYCTELPFEAKLHWCLVPVPAGSMTLLAGQIAVTTRHFVEHRFDLLGSGWVQVKHGMRCRGLEEYQYDMGSLADADTEGDWLKGRINPSNLRESQRIWKLIAVDSSKIKAPRMNGLRISGGRQSSKYRMYVPIDWHLDFKSGYRWSESTWYKDICYGHKLGVDVKVPWELARMQHLPQLALAYALAAQKSEEKWPSDFTGQAKPKSQSNEDWQETEFENQKSRMDQLESSELYAQEFRNQVLDFIATNPPRFGVNWACTMDVSIRASNWLLAYDMFHCWGGYFDDAFEAVFFRSIYEHGLHIVNNLEWQDRVRGNHYLSDIVGLTFIAAYLPPTGETDAWLAFAVQELITEMEHQFYPDGTNFEGSTAYHRLSAEMVYYSTALVLGLPQERLEKLKEYDPSMQNTGWGKPKLKPGPMHFYKLQEGPITSFSESPFPAWYFERMERMAEFIMDITKPSGHIPQIGDNDSGRFFKLGPKYERMTVKQAKKKYANLDGYSDLPDDADYFMEDHLDCSHLVAAAHGLFNRDDFAECLGGKENALSMPDCFVVRSLFGGTAIGSQRFEQRKKEDNYFFYIGTQDAFEKAIAEIEAKPKDQVRIAEFPAQGGDLRQRITLRAYPDFGLYLYSLPGLYLAIRCWPGREPFHSGHMHNDQLSIELVIDGKEQVIDPGTYLYTSLPDARNHYRSGESHFLPWVKLHEADMFESSLFEVERPVRAQVQYIDMLNYIGEYSHQEYGAVRRWIQVRENSVSITDSAENQILPAQHMLHTLYSSGYGIRQK